MGERVKLCFKKCAMPMTLSTDTSEALKSLLSELLRCC